MRALVAVPGRAGTTEVVEVPDARAADGEVLVRTIEVGVCGTDREISGGLFGVAPEGAERLIIGHELFGVVERGGHGFDAGDLVTATVRRSCGHCAACRRDAPDACATSAPRAFSTRKDPVRAATCTRLRPSSPIRAVEIP